MELNTDFSQRVVIHSEQIPWQASPMAGVDRRMLDRMGGEVARATSIVRYQPDSHFSPHVHQGGEEFFVLSGVFEDENGEYPVGSYVRNPPQSSHTPGSTPGCIIFVKLWQFDAEDLTPVNINFDQLERVTDGRGAGVHITPLFQNSRERVRIEYWRSGLEVEVDTRGGAEVFVLDGSFVEGTDSLGMHSWLRVPVGRRINAKAGKYGARVWIKSGHLLFVSPPDAAA